MGALQVMQEIGKQWQQLTQEQKQYFKNKADLDKVRYLKEQKLFYDEVEQLGYSQTCEKGGKQGGTSELHATATGSSNGYLGNNLNSGSGFLAHNKNLQALTEASRN